MQFINILITLFFIVLSIYFDNWWIIGAYCCGLLLQAITVEVSCTPMERQFKDIKKAAKKINNTY
jgi:hypothetical protein